MYTYLYLYSSQDRMSAVGRKLSVPFPDSLDHELLHPPITADMTVFPNESVIVNPWSSHVFTWNVMLRQRLISTP